MKRILILVSLGLFLCSTAIAFQGGAGESTKKKANPPKTSVSKPDTKEKQGLPQFRTGTPYRSVRKELMKLGWQPVTLPSARPCGDDDRCRGFSEVYFCSGVGSATCIYTWTKKTTLIRVYAEREFDQTYAGLRPCPLHSNQIDDGFACESETIRANEREPDGCAFCGTWHFVGSPFEVMPSDYYLKISKAGTGRFKVVEGFNQNGEISWYDDRVTNAVGIYLKMLNGRLEGRFVTSNFLYSTHGNETTYKINCELISNNKMRYSVWSAIRGKTDKFVGTKIGN